MNEDYDSEKERADFVTVRQQRAVDFHKKAFKALSEGEYYEFVLNLNYFRMANLQLPWGYKITQEHFVFIEEVGKLIVSHLEKEGSCTKSMISH